MGFSTPHPSFREAPSHALRLGGGVVKWPGTFREWCGIPSKGSVSSEPCLALRGGILSRAGAQHALSWCQGRLGAFPEAGRSFTFEGMLQSFPRRQSFGSPSLKPEQGTLKPAVTRNYITSRSQGTVMSCTSLAQNVTSHPWLK